LTIPRGDELSIAGLAVLDRAGRGWRGVTQPCLASACCKTCAANSSAIPRSRRWSTKLSLLPHRICHRIASLLGVEDVNAREKRLAQVRRELARIEVRIRLDEDVEDTSPLDRS
jgi:hypothetical protein